MAKQRSTNVIVTLREVRGDPVRLIKKFIKKTKKEKIIEEFKSRMFYEKKSSKKRKKAEALRRKKLDS